MKKKVLITGGAGFIGSNAADYFLKRDVEVAVVDNFSRPGSIHNANWLREKYKKKLQIIEGDIAEDIRKITAEIGKSDLIVHMAGQVAVTSSIKNPRHDFETNLLGTLNILEAMRKQNSKAILIYGSTNKVYGSLENIPLKEMKTRYAFLGRIGIDESVQLDFHTPYACSKGAADQYIRDYARIYGLKTIVFRQSCIYGPRQFGIEDQGWVAWFLIAAMHNRKITIYGNGKQVRDLLYVDDLLEAIELASEKIKKTSGEIYNIGGGIENSLSIWKEFGPLLERVIDKSIPASFKPTRQGDQKIFITDYAKAKKDFSWKPRMSVEKGLRLLQGWIEQNEALFVNSRHEDNVRRDNTQ